jgi:hypothetical protein
MPVRDETADYVSFGSPGKLVTGSVDRLYISGAAGVRFQLPPQVEDMNIYRAVEAFKIISENHFNELFPTEYPTWFSGKHAQQFELDGGKL